MKEEKNMAKTTINEEQYNKLANKLVNITDKFLEMESIVKTINIWVKENDYELIPLMKILNNKIEDMAGAINK